MGNCNASSLVAFGVCIVIGFASLSMSDRYLGFLAVGLYLLTLIIGSIPSVKSPRSRSVPLRVWILFVVPVLMIATQSISDWPILIDNKQAFSGIMVKIILFLIGCAFFDAFTNLLHLVKTRKLDVKSSTGEKSGIKRGDR